jgi:predicted ATPase/DNA-binding CsgD family transcriptional regulator
LRELGTHSAGDLVADFLRERRLLIILDNFEQVSPAVAHVAPLLSACSGVVLLVTSRALLHIAGEQRFPVAPLAVTEDGRRETEDGGPAVQLFVARAQAVEPRFALSEEHAATVTAICLRLDGLPLAIELAAARLRHFSPDELLARLRSTLPLLTGGPADAPDRLRTMDQAISWSYTLLSADEQALFRRLALFVGGFTLDAVEAIDHWPLAIGSEEEDRRTSASRQAMSQQPTANGQQPTVLDLLASLVDKSLVQAVGEGHVTRFAMLETIREFGLAQLAASGEAETIAARHAAWCVRLADRMRQSGRISHQDGLALLEVEQPNFRAALGWHLERGEATAAMHLAGQLAEFWMRRGHHVEGGVWLERALASDPGTPSVARAVALVGLNMLLWVPGDHSRAERLLCEAELVAREVGDAGALAYVRLHQGYVALFQGNHALAQARAEESLETALVIPQELSLNGARWLLAVTALALGENECATERFERLLESARTEGDDISIANSLFGLAILAKRRGELASALAGFAQAATVCRSYGDRSYASAFLDEGAAIAVEVGAAEAAVRLFAFAEAMRKTTGAVRGFASTVGNRSDEELLRLLGDARITLGAKASAAAWAAGGTLSLDEAIAELEALAGEANQVTVSHLGDAGGFGKLTAREREILRLLIAGRSDKEIAAALGISAGTVSKHVLRIRDKLKASSRTAAATLAVRYGLS